MSKNSIIVLKIKSGPLTEKHSELQEETNAATWTNPSLEPKKAHKLKKYASFLFFNDLITFRVILQ